MKIFKIAMILGAVFFGYSVFASDPVISEVTVHQRWPWSKLVNIDYVLTCDATQSVDIVVSGFNDRTELVLPRASLSGDLENVSNGARRVVWDPTATAYTNAGVLGKFSVALTPAPVPLYMIVDLTKTEGAPGQIQYVYESDLRAGTWGSWVENPITNAGTVIKSVVWTGVTNDASYATDKLVLRHVPAGSFGMGRTAVSTTLTKAFYAGVFTVTDAQWKKIMGGATPTTMPRTSVSYDDIRGLTTDDPPINWPTTGRTRVAPGSFLGKLRSQTGLNDLDLPTCAQWEYLCRARTTTLYNDGNADAVVVGSAPGTTNAWMDVLGWYYANTIGANNYGKKPVGQKIANAWGLYDTHGNVREWTLDWYEVTFLGGADPTGPDSGPFRLTWGGSWDVGPHACVSVSFSGAPASARDGGIGFRLVRTLQ